jgi:hypothetical protein
MDSTGKTTGVIIVELPPQEGPDALNRPQVFHEKKVASFKEFQFRPRNLVPHRFPTGGRRYSVVPPPVPLMPSRRGPVPRSS